LETDPQRTDRSFPDIPKGYKTWNDYVKAVLAANDMGLPGPRPYNVYGEDAAPGTEPLAFLINTLGYGRLAPLLDQSDPRIQTFLDSTYASNTGRDEFSIFGDQFFPALMGLGAFVGGSAALGAFAPAAGAGAAAGGGAVGAGEAAAGAGGALGGGGALGEAAAGVGAGAGVGGGGGGLGLGEVLGGAGVLGGGGAGGKSVLGNILKSAGGGGGTLSDIAQIAGLVAPAIGAVGSVAGGVLGAQAAKSSAETQADAAREANQLLAQMYLQNRADLAPYREAGYASLGELRELTGTPLTTDPYEAPAALDPSGYAFDPAQYAFQAPVQALDPAQYAFQAPVQALNPADYAFTATTGQQVLDDDPGYQFRVSEGRKALDAQAAAKGGLISGGALKAAQNYGQQLASQEYGRAYERGLGRNVMNYERGLQQNKDIYGRALTENELRYGRGLQQNQDIYGRALTENQMGYERGLQGNQMRYGRDYQANQDVYNRGLTQYQTNYNVRSGDRTRRFNELAALAGVGQTATGQGIQAGERYVGQAAGNVTGAGAATAAGQMGASNAWKEALSGVGGAANSYLNNQLLMQLLGRR
jgi:hypothetical protein